MLDAQIGLRHSRGVVQPNRFMTNLIRNRLWFLAILAFSCEFCFAQPSGEFSVDIDNLTPLIDMSGDFQVADQILGAGDQTVSLNFDLGITHLSSGAIHGSGTTIAQIGDDFVPAFYRANGRVSGGGENPIHVFLAVRLFGEWTVGGLDTKFKISVAYNLTFNRESGELEGISRGRANLTRLGGGRISSDEISVGLPGGGDGSWSIDMIVVPFKKLSGSAQITLSGGRQVNGALAGHLFGDLSELKFTGTNVDRGSSATFSFSPVEGVQEVETVRGKILGQRVLF